MVFSSPVFLFLFLPLTLAAVLLARGTRARNVVLLIASLLFYAWGEGVYLLLMLATILVNHLAGLALARWPGHRGPLVAAIVLDLGALAWFKYAGFLAGSLAPLFAALGLPLPPMQPGARPRPNGTRVRWPFTSACSPS